jgi:hypothetical protein
VSQPQALFERLFGDTPADTVRATAALSAGLESSGSAELAATQEESSALLAGHLDGGLDEAASRALAARLATSPEAFHEATAAADFIDTVKAECVVAPAALVASAMAVPRPTKKQPRPTHWRLTAAMAVLTMAVLAAMMILERPVSKPGDTTLPVATAPAPAAPQLMMPAGNLDTVPLPKK